MYKLTLLDKISIILVIIGALNWGLIGLFNFNLVSFIFGTPADVISRIIYILVGVGGIDMILLIIKSKRNKC